MTKLIRKDHQTEQSSSAKISKLSYLCTLILYYAIQILEEEMPEVDEAKEGEIESDEKPVESAKTKERRWSVVAQKILMEALVAGDSEETLKRLKKASDNLVSNGDELNKFKC